MSKSDPISIVILGGGTAGWMAANLLARDFPNSAIKLVESKEIGIIGVGEGSTPHLKLFFDAIQVPDKEWMPRCNATYKNGITFAGWSAIPGFESYFHPFAAQLDDVFTLPLFYDNVRARMQGHNVNAHPDKYFLETYLTNNNLGPIPQYSFPFGVAYGYHFDSALLGQFLADKAQERGVKRIFGNVELVATHPSGDIKSLTLASGEAIDGDLFIDCSGFQSKLLQQALNVDFISFKDNLFNDAAVVLPSDITSPLPVATKATALSCGWAWQIPLTNRFGNGYVYSGDFLSEAQAEHELRSHLNLLDSDINAKHLTMKVGRVTKHWHKNCVAVGLSQGFIEPLEATAIALSFNTITQFIRCYKQGNGSAQFQEDFNRDINGRFEGIRDYIVCHYKANQRQNNPYWRDNAQNMKISNRLNHILNLWQESADFADELRKQNLFGSYQPKSWACLLAGYGIFPINQQSQAPSQQHIAELKSVEDFIKRCGLNFPVHADLLVQPD